MANLIRAALALLLFGCGEVDAQVTPAAEPAGITDVAWCACVLYAPGCGEREGVECLALTDVAQLEGPLWECVTAVVADGPLNKQGQCERNHGGYMLPGLVSPR